MFLELEEVSSKPPLLFDRFFWYITRVEWAQVVHYMRATETPYGLLINFGRPQLQYDTFDKETLPNLFE